jgi:ACR3 family arsenite transporter
MVIGVVIGVYVKGVQKAFNTARFDSVSVRECRPSTMASASLIIPTAIAIGLMIMMWPILTKVQYEAIPKIFSASKIWVHVGISLFLNWIVGPLIMVGLAWATLPDLPTYRTGVILVGLARCIAMVMIWNSLARGDGDYCAILVTVNSVLQIILYSPYSLLFINVVGGKESVRVKYRNVAISVLIVCVPRACIPPNARSLSAALCSTWAFPF